jgi:hypothetical protein
MRILEQCSSSWPLPEIQAQVDSLRIAFSADINRPFTLRPSFPYGTPSESSQSPPPPFDQHYNTQINQVHVHPPNSLGFSTTNPMSPPISAGAEESKTNSPKMLTLPPQSQGLTVPPNRSVMVPLTDEQTWDPSQIIK